MNKQDGVFFYIILLILVFTGAFLWGNWAKGMDIERSCIYSNRIELRGHVFHCLLMPNVSVTDEQYERKDHPNKGVLE